VGEKVSPKNKNNKKKNPLGKFIRHDYQKGRWKNSTRTAWIPSHKGVWCQPGLEKREEGGGAKGKGEE